MNFVDDLRSCGRILVKVFEWWDVSLATNHWILLVSGSRSRYRNSQRNFCHCGIIGTVVGISRDPLPWWRFAASECLYAFISALEALRDALYKYSTTTTTTTEECCSRPIRVQTRMFMLPTRGDFFLVGL